MDVFVFSDCLITRDVIDRKREMYGRRTCGDFSRKMKTKRLPVIQVSSGNQSSQVEHSRRLTLRRSISFHQQGMIWRVECFRDHSFVVFVHRIKSTIKDISTTFRGQDRFPFLG